MADSPDPITSPPSRDYQPYDPAGPAGDVAGWAKLGSDDFPDGPGPWRQC